MGKQYLNGVLYGTGEIIKFSPEIYSFEEREVGVWTDGKPLYQKSFLIPASTITGDNTFTIPLGLQDVDKVIDYNAIIMLTGTNRFARLPLSLDTKPISVQNEYSYNLQYYDKTTDILRIDIGSQTSHQGGYGTIWYTKTTDVPGSGHYTTNSSEAHHYSTEEQVVGTWIDGKPLYEKTVYFTTPTQSQADTEIIVGNIGINNATILRQEYTFYCNGSLSHSYNDGVLERDGWKSVTARIIDGYIYVKMITGSGNVNYYAYCEQNAFVIVQYTKTTD